ncbi:MAG: hypothetical protein JWQ83_1783 [Lacunisphaera sp.]|nr:hypothetical protein [Lacunisphaera sp.]
MVDAISRRSLLLLSLTTAMAGSLPALAQTPTSTPTSTPTAAPAPPEKKPFSPAELDQILAPIALYDDALLSQVLMAATYPLEVVEASRWQQANPTLTGDAAVKAVADKGWDVSVKSLVAFPTILKQMNDHLDWTQKLGDALLGQQSDVAASIQRLRAKAAAAGTLKTGAGPQYTVSTQSQGSETNYAIAQTSPEVVYVPSYDPNTAYGAWSDPAYPPSYWPMGGVLARGLLWGAGIAAAGALFGGWNWGYGGGGGYVNVNANRAVNIDRNFNRNNIGSGDRWQHQVDHRRGVGYRDPATRQQFGQTRPGAAQREQFRGQIERPAQGPAGGAGANRPGGPGGGAGARPGGGPGAGGGGVQRPAQRPAQRPGGAGQGPGGGALGGVNRGGAVNREAQRGRAQQQRSGGRAGGARGGGGGGGGQRGGGGGGRPSGGGGGGNRGGGGGGQRGGGGGGRR